MTHTWVKHTVTGNHWQCPNEALAYYRGLGWEPSDAPVEPDPAAAEMLAVRAAQAEQAAVAEPKPTKPRRGEPQEG